MVTAYDSPFMCASRGSVWTQPLHTHRWAVESVLSVGFPSWSALCLVVTALLRGDGRLQHSEGPGPVPDTCWLLTDAPLAVSPLAVC